MAILYDTEKQMFVKSNHIVVNEDDYYNKLEANKDDIANNRAKLIFDTETNTVVVKKNVMYAHIFELGNFVISDKKDSVDPDLVKLVLPIDISSIKDSSDTCNYYDFEEEKFKTVVLKEDEHFDWNTKRVAKTLPAGIENKKYDLLKQDLVAKMKEIGVKINHPKYGDIYYPITAESINMILLLKEVPQLDRRLLFYLLDGEYLNLDVSRHIPVNNLGDNIVADLSSKILHFQTYIGEVVATFKTRLVNTTDVEETTELVKNYIQIILKDLGDK